MEKILDPKVLAKLSNLYLVARSVVEGFIAGIHRSIYKGFSVEFFEHREYSPGDDLKYLDWKVFGRTDRLYLKTFREETNLKSYILLDISNSMSYKSDTVSKLEYGIFLAESQHQSGKNAPIAEGRTDLPCVIVLSRIMS